MSAPEYDPNIDPALYALSELPNGALTAGSSLNAVAPTSTFLPAPSSSSIPRLRPAHAEPSVAASSIPSEHLVARDATGQIRETKEAYTARLLLVKRKEPLRAALKQCGIHNLASSETTTKLRERLVWYCFPEASRPRKSSTAPPAKPPQPPIPTRPPTEHDVLASALSSNGASVTLPPPASRRPIPVIGPMRSEFAISAPRTNIEVSLARAQPAASSSTASAQSRRPSPPRVSQIPVPSGFARRPSTSDTTRLLGAPLPQSAGPLPPSSAGNGRVPESAESASGPATPPNPAPAAPSQRRQHVIRADIESSPQPATPQRRVARDDEQAALEATPVHIPAVTEDGDDDEDAGLLREFEVEGAAASELLGYDEDGGGDYDEDFEGDDEGEEEEEELPEEDSEAFRAQVRVRAVKRAEGNRRKGGLKTQQSVVKDWTVWVRMAIDQSLIPDIIVDEHSLLLYIEYSAERPKKSKRGEPIPGTHIGASQLKKLFFGVLRIRKQQEAANRLLKTQRPAVSVIVWDAIKNRMNEAIKRQYIGFDDAEDAPDIRANTWLSMVDDEQLDRIGRGFLAHRHLRLAVFGHLAWATQHATGNRGDDFRAIKLAELQPVTLLHPNQKTGLYAVVALQSEEKAPGRGMQTTVNPTYSTMLANMYAHRCPLGALAIYLHWLYDDKQLLKVMKEIKFTVNKSWRQVRLIQGPKAPTIPFQESSLYNLYCKAFTAAGFSSGCKQHLPRRLLGYRQAKLGVDKSDTEKLGWRHGQTFFDRYAPALPMPAILACAGYKTDETYDPIWRNIAVPAQFLELVCPMAEEHIIALADKAELSGAFHHWTMVRDLRPYLFQCGAALLKLVPNSAIFKLPAFANRDVQNWMRNRYPVELERLQASVGDPLSFERVQNEQLRNALYQLQGVCQAQVAEISKLRQLIERRTAIFSPAQGYSASDYQVTGPDSSQQYNMPPPPVRVHQNENAEETGTYSLGDADGTLRAFASPASNGSPRVATQVDLVLPPINAFSQQGQPIGLVPPVLGKKGVTWPEIFRAIKQPHFCWEAWGITKSVDEFETVESMWNVWSIGEPAEDVNGRQTGMKPPLQLVEQHFKHQWRTLSSSSVTEKNRVSQAWSRFREIPEWIESEARLHGVAPADVIAELELWRGEGKTKKSLNQLQKEVKKRRRDAAMSQLGPVAAEPELNTTSDASGAASEAPAASTSSLGPPIQLQVPVAVESRKRKPAIGARRPAAGVGKARGPGAEKLNALGTRRTSDGRTAKSRRVAT